MENWSVKTDFRRNEGFQGETVTHSDLGRTPAIASPNPWGSVEPSLRTTALNS